MDEYNAAPVVSAFLLFAMVIAGAWYFGGTTEEKEDDLLYQKGMEHGLRGYPPDQDRRPAYQDGYSDGQSRRNTQKTRTSLSQEVVSKML